MVCADNDLITMIIILDPPSIIRSPTNVTVNRGDSVMLQCEFQGIPTPTVTWLHNNRAVASSKYSVDASGLSNLTLSNIAISDSGKYWCQVENTFMAIDSSAAFVTVYCTC